MFYKLISYKFYFIMSSDIVAVNKITFIYYYSGLWCSWSPSPSSSGCLWSRKYPDLYDVSFFCLFGCLVIHFLSLDWLALRIWLSIRFLNPSDRLNYNPNCRNWPQSEFWGFQFFDEFINFVVCSKFCDRF